MAMRGQVRAIDTLPVLHDAPYGLRFGALQCMCYTTTV